MLKKITPEYLKRKGFDGLFNPGECACLIADLAPCGKIQPDCEPGYRAPCDCGDHDWHIQREKPEEE